MKSALTSCKQIAESVHAGVISVEEVVRAHIDRVRAVNRELNAVVLLDEEGALRAAKDADRRRARGEYLGPLGGVPFTVKDSVDAAGLRRTAGMVTWREQIAERDASVVARLRAAGAILLGKTNLPALSEGFETDNLLFGRTNHPADPTRTPGGSSGGEGAIIAAGGSPLGIGADASGSVRVPAHFCGLAALKPTSGRTPTDGHFPPALGRITERLQFAAMARTIEDVALATRALAQGEAGEHRPRTMPLRDLDTVDPARLRVAWHTANGIMPVSAEIEKAVVDAARILSRAGALVEEARPPGLIATVQIMPSLFYGIDGGRSFRAYLQEAGETRLSPLLARALERAAAHEKSESEFAALLDQWQDFRDSMLHFMERYDVMLCPVASIAAPLHGETLRSDPMLLFSYAMTFNLTGWPAAVVRAGTSVEGLPIGVQLAARPWREDIALAAARVIERALCA